MKFKSKVDMAWALGSTQGNQCWCGKHVASGYNHQKVFMPFSCGSKECEKLQAEYDSLPDGDGKSSVFGMRRATGRV